MVLFRFPAFLILCLATLTTQAAPVSGQGTWETTLQGRAPLTPGGTDYQAYYDDVLNITWLANANLARSTYSPSSTPGFGTSFGVPGIQVGGQMAAATAAEWIAGVNAATYLGRSDWRLPKITDTGNDGCVFAYAGTDCGYNPDLSTGEMAHLFYSTLGNTAAVDGNGHPQPCSQNTPNLCLSNSGPFFRLVTNIYWSPLAGNDQAIWTFAFQSGLQGPSGPRGYAWPVLNGDAFAMVPIPHAVWLFASALGVMGWMRRKAAA